MDTHKQMARRGMFYLKEAVLDVLWEARCNKETYLQTDEIRKRLGIPPTTDERSGHNSFILGVLYYLRDERSVDRLRNPQNEWKISEQEASLRARQ